MVSTSETYPVGSEITDSAHGGQSRTRHDSAPLLMLPGPLSANSRNGPSAASNSSLTAFSRNSEDVPPDTGSRSRLISQTNDSFSDVQSQGLTDVSSPITIESYVNRAGLGSGGAVLRQGTLSSQYPGETQNPYRFSQTQAQMASYEDDFLGGGTNDSDSTQGSSTSPLPRVPSRGVTLSDNGPVPGPDGVRRVARPQSRRPFSLIGGLLKIVGNAH